MFVENSLHERIQPPPQVDRRQRMPAQSRFVKSIVSTSKSQDVKMPWTRGATRKAMIARRQKATIKAVSVAKSA
jgi:hypothetical protein